MEPFKLRQCQQEMLDAIRANDRGIICSFVGTGKSRVKSIVIYETDGHKLVVFPSLNLVQQFTQTYAPEAFILTTEQPKTESQIAEHFSQESGIIATTYQSIHKLAKYFSSLSLVLFDEAHHICTPRLIALLEELDRHQTRRFFFTATPKETKALSMFTEPSEDDSSDLSDSTDSETERVAKSEQLLGNLLYEYGFTNAMTDGVISDYALGFAVYKQTDEKKETAQLRNILRLAKNYNRKRILVYNQYVVVTKHGKTNTKNFSQDSECVRSITGKTSRYEREEIFGWFQEKTNDVRVLCNVGTIKEGVDLPCIDMIAFCDEKHSRIDIIQCLGRGLRLYPNKESCLVTCCVPVRDSQISATEFKTIKDVLCTLKSIDARVSDVLLGKPSSLAFYYDGENDVDFSKQGFQRLVSLGVFGNWFEMLEKVDSFISEKGKRPSRKTKDPQEKSLGSWLSNQIRTQRKVKLPVDRMEAFQAMIKKYPDLFDEDKTDKVWFSLLKEVDFFLGAKEKRPSNSAKDPKEKRLGMWLSRQLKYQKKDKLPINRMEVFRTMTIKYPGLFDEDKPDKVWYQTLKEVDSFISEKGKRPRDTVQDTQEKRLNKWLSHQIKYQRKNKLQADRMGELQAMITKHANLFDEDKNNKIWYQTLKEVNSFISEKGKRPQPNLKDPQEKRLESWLSNQITFQRKDKLPTDRLEAFQAMITKYPDLFDEDRDDKVWYQNLKEVECFINVKGKRPIQQAKDPQEKHIGQWLQHQIRYQKQDKLPADRMEAFQAMVAKYPDLFDEDKWFSLLKEVDSFLGAKGKRPAGSSKDPQENRLGQWLSVQITNQRKDKLPADRMEAFQGMVSKYPDLFDEDRDDKVWYSMLKEVDSFLSAKGNRPRQKAKDLQEKRIGQWLSDQRKYKLPTDRMKAFQAMIAKYPDLFPIENDAHHKLEETISTPIEDKHSQKEVCPQEKKYSQKDNHSREEARHQGKTCPQEDKILQENTNSQKDNHAEELKEFPEVQWTTTVEQVASELDLHGKLVTGKLIFWWRRTKREFDNGSLPQCKRTDVEDLIIAFGIA